MQTKCVWFDMPVKENAWPVIRAFITAWWQGHPSVRISISNPTVNITVEPEESTLGKGAE
jgi:hypothetical protein